MALNVSDTRLSAPVRRSRLDQISRSLHGWRLWSAVTLAYLAYALIVTWPLATNISGLLSAPNYLEDAAGTASSIAYMIQHHLVPFLPAHMADMNAPEGASQPWALYLGQAPAFLPWWLLSLAFGTVAGGNVFMLLGFVASGVAMFAFVQQVFGSRLVALFAGFAFAFYPFPVSAASVHYEFVHGWPIVLCVWGLIELIEAPSRRHALLAGSATALAMWFNPYYELIAGAALATCLPVCVAVGYARRNTRQALTACATTLLPVAALAVFFVALLKLGGSSAGTIARPISQVYSFSAHLWQYLLPGPYSPLVGHLTGPYLAARLGISDFWDSAVYPGYTVIVLAVAGFLPALRVLRTRRGALADRYVVTVLTAGLLAAVAFVSSGPPTVRVLGLNVPLVSDVVYHIAPDWQTFARFVILLELALVLMMAAELARMRRTLVGRRKVLVFSVIGLLLAVDLWDSPPQRTVSTKPQPAYVWLRDHPGGIVADYPILPAYDSAEAQALYWGVYDEHPLFEGFPLLSRDESLKLDLADLADPQTAGKLAAYGVRYIVVHRGAPGSSIPQLRARGYRSILIDRHGPSLWRVPDSPAAATVDAASGFNWLDGYPTYDTRLLTGSGTLLLGARNCTRCTGTLSLTVSGTGQRLRLSVGEGSRLSLASTIVPAKGTVTLRAPVTIRKGAAVVSLHTAPRGYITLTESTTRLTVS